jgi:hypothetical protein
VGHTTWRSVEQLRRARDDVGRTGRFTSNWQIQAFAVCAFPS